MADPLVVTLAVPEAVQQSWDRERTALFPAGRTRVGAHVTLFHAVPGSLEQAVREDLSREVGDAFDLRVTGVMSLGRGAAYRLESDELAALHGRLRRAWQPHLTPQDRQGFRPHVTVQNKVDPAVARRTVAELRAGFVPHDVRAVGLDLWRYVGGPWELIARVPFGVRPL